MLSRVHYVADHNPVAAPERVVALVEVVLGAGVRCVQLRSKDRSDRQRYEVARGVAALCREAGSMCVVNDRIDIALAVGADGAHVGPDDLPVAQARRLLGPRAVLGASAYTLEEALAAAAGGASYLGVGPCYQTASKDGLPGPIGAEGLARIAGAVHIPVIAIGGVTAARAPELLEAGAFGVAVINAIAGAHDPATAARELVLAMSHTWGGRG